MCKNVSQDEFIIEYTPHVSDQHEVWIGLATYDLGMQLMNFLSYGVICVIGIGLYRSLVTVEKNSV